MRKQQSPYLLLLIAAIMLASCTISKADDGRHIKAALKSARSEIKEEFKETRSEVKSALKKTRKAIKTVVLNENSKSAVSEDLNENAGGAVSSDETKGSPWILVDISDPNGRRCYLDDNGAPLDDNYISYDEAREDLPDITRREALLKACQTDLYGQGRYPYPG